MLPTLVHDGRVLIESPLINGYLEEPFPVTPLAPGDPAARHAMRLWVETIDETVHPAAAAATYAIGARLAQMLLPPAQREANPAAIPDPARRADAAFAADIAAAAAAKGPTSRTVR